MNITRIAIVSLLALSLGAHVATADVVLYRYATFTDGFTFNATCKDLNERVRTYQGTCWQTCCHGEDSREVPCTKKASLNDDFRAIEITGANTVVEVYEDSSFRGRYVRFQGPGRWVLPAWLWDRASSIAVY